MWVTKGLSSTLWQNGALSLIRVGIPSGCDSKGSPVKEKQLEKAPFSSTWSLTKKHKLLVSFRKATETHPVSSQLLSGQLHLFPEGVEHYEGNSKL